MGIFNEKLSQEIADNIPGKGCAEDEWNDEFEGCDCQNLVSSRIFLYFLSCFNPLRGTAKLRGIRKKGF